MEGRSRVYPILLGVTQAFWILQWVKQPNNTLPAMGVLGDLNITPPNIFQENQYISFFYILKLLLLALLIGAVYYGTLLMNYTFPAICKNDNINRN